MASCRPHFFYAIGRHESTSLFKVRLIFALLILLLWAISGTNAFAQAVYGSIAGTVYDSSGAGVPKAARARIPASNGELQRDGQA